MTGRRVDNRLRAFIAVICLLSFAAPAFAQAEETRLPLSAPLSFVDGDRKSVG